MIPACQILPTNTPLPPTKTPRPTATLLPPPVCTIKLNTDVYGFHEISDAVAPYTIGQPDRTSTPNFYPTPPTPVNPLPNPSTPNDKWIALPANTQVGVYLRYINTTFVQIIFQGRYLWIWSGNVTLVPGSPNCNLPSVSPTQLPINYTATPVDFFIRQQLLQYGVVLDNRGQSWTLAEQEIVLAAVQDIGLAFQRLLQARNSPRASDPIPVIFRYVLRTENQSAPLTLARDSKNFGYCETNNYTKTITCYGNVALTKYVLVHELGHVFDSQTGANNGKKLSKFVEDTQSTPITDARGAVMGNFTTNNGSQWRRGERGWGSGPGSEYVGGDDRNEPLKAIYTDFQQHPAPYPASQNKFEETAADMFLNWVYDAFQNRSWKPIDQDTNGSCSRPSGCLDSVIIFPVAPIGASGDARRAWMNTTMNAIFQIQNW
jgi:hypothetical protein